MRFFTPAISKWRVGNGRAVFSPAGVELDPTALSGVVDVRARIEDQQSFLGFWKELWRLETWHHPSRVRLKIVRLDDGDVVIDREVFRTDVTLDTEGPSPVGFSQHFAPGTKQNLRAPTAIKLGRQGRGELWFRLFAATGAEPYWDTTTVANGPYRLRITAWDVAGNRGHDHGRRDGRQPVGAGSHPARKGGSGTRPYASRRTITGPCRGRIVFRPAKGGSGITVAASRPRPGRIRCGPYTRSQHPITTVGAGSHPAQRAGRGPAPTPAAGTTTRPV